MLLTTASNSSYNIGQIAYLQSCKHNLEHIYFGGSFIRGHRQTMDTLSYAIRYWSNNEKSAYFLRHEGYLGAVGAFLQRQPANWGRKNSMDDLQKFKSASLKPDAEDGDVSWRNMPAIDTFEGES